MMMNGGDTSRAHLDLKGMTKDELLAIIYPMCASTFAATSDINASTNAGIEQVIDFMREHCVGSQPGAAATAATVPTAAEEQKESSSEEESDSKEDTPKQKKADAKAVGGALAWRHEAMHNLTIQFEMERDKLAGVGADTCGPPTRRI